MITKNRESGCSFFWITETHHGCISEAFDSLKNPTTDGSHCEGTSAVVYYSPWTKHTHTHTDNAQAALPRLHI